MKISNNTVVSTMKETNGGEAPSIQWGSLDPCKNYSDSTLYNLKPGSIYIQQIYTEVNCQRTYSGTCLWYKKYHSGGDLCSGARGKSNDWAKIATGGLSCGTEKPSGAPEFCKMALMSWYAHIVDAPSQSGCNCTVANCGCEAKADQSIHLYFKVNDNCASEDWMLIHPSIERPNVIKHKPYAGDSHEAEWLNCLPVGSHIIHIDCDTGAVIGFYIKLSNNCNSIKDWSSLTDRPCLSGPLDPNKVAEGELKDKLDCMSAGDSYWQVIDTGKVGEDGEPVTCSVLWVLDCDGAWHSPGSNCVIEGDGLPDGAALCDLPIGSIYVDTSECKKSVYEKLYNNCDDDDWCSWHRPSRFARMVNPDFEFPVPTDVEAPVIFTPTPVATPPIVGEAEQILASVNSSPNDFEFNDNGEICLTESACPGYFDLTVSNATQTLGENGILTTGITLNGVPAGRETLHPTGNPNFPYVSSPFTVPDVWLNPGDCVGSFVFGNQEGILVEGAYVSIQESE